jgi:alkaline phosphatase D
VDGIVTTQRARIVSLPRWVLGVLAWLLAGVLGLSPGRAEDSERLLVTVGSVTSTSAVFWAHSEQREPITLTLTSTEAGYPVTRTEASRAPGSDGIVRTPVRGLAARTRYDYRVSTSTESVVGHFTTAPDATQREPVRFLWSGDLGGVGHCRRTEIGYPIFRAMARREPAFFVFVGDTIYADNRCVGPDIVAGSEHKAETLAEFHAKHRYNRADPAVQAFFRTVGVYAIWDDHDVRDGFSGSRERLAPIGLRAFLDYWPILPPEDDPTRLYRRVRWGGLVELFILDTRQYRSGACEQDSDAKTMLGEAQRRWLIDGVARSDAQWKVVVSSVPFSIPKGWPCADTWAPRRLFGWTTGFGLERDAILNAFREQQVGNVVILSTDVHYADFVRLPGAAGFTVHEFTAGPLSANPKRPKRLDEGLAAQRLFATGGVTNFGEIAIDQAALTARLFDAQGRLLAATTIGAGFAGQATIIE